VSVQRLDAASLTDAATAPLAAVEQAATAVDSPHLPPQGTRPLRLRWRHGWDGHPVDHLFAAGRGSALLAYATVIFGHWDNPHAAELELIVHPDARGDDEVADALLHHAIEACRAAGRTRGISDCWRDSWLAGYWARRDWPVASLAAQRRIVIADLDRPLIARLLADTEQASPDYAVEVLPLPTPPDLMDGVLELHRAMNDAPLDDLRLDDDEWSVARLAGVESASTHRGLRVHRLIARRRGDGVIGGWTQLVVDPSQPALGHQEDTAVVGAHRGHRLGLRLKTAMLQLLTEVEPQLEMIDTWNAESNTHMIRVNEQLGCVVVGHGSIVQRDLG